MYGLRMPSKVLAILELLATGLATGKGFFADKGWVMASLVRSELVFLAKVSGRYALSTAIHASFVRRILELDIHSLLVE